MIAILEAGVVIAACFLIGLTLSNSYFWAWANNNIEMKYHPESKDCYNRGSKDWNRFHVRGEDVRTMITTMSNEDRIWGRLKSRGRGYDKTLYRKIHV
jgi:hypothetical protein